MPVRVLNPPPLAHEPGPPPLVMRSHEYPKPRTSHASRSTPYPWRQTHANPEALIVGCDTGSPSTRKGVYGGPLATKRPPPARIMPVVLCRNPRNSRGMQNSLRIGGETVRPGNLASQAKFLLERCRRDPHIVRVTLCLRRVCVTAPFNGTPYRSYPHPHW